MKKVKIAGKMMPAIGIGTWHMGSSRDTHALHLSALRAGLDAGARIIDTAEMYGSGDAEILVGEAIQPYSRDDLFLISKVLPSNANQARMEKSLDASLKRLQTDYLDLYLYHWRGMTPLSETVKELERLKEKGKIKAWGVSNFDTPDLEELNHTPGGENAQANEVLYNLGSRNIEYDLISWQIERQITLIAYSPVGAGTANHGTQIAKNPVVQEIAKRHNASSYQIMLAWAIRDGQTIAIPQSNIPEHMKENIAAGEISLSSEDLAQLDQAYPKPTTKRPLSIL
ncbi:aldo/keto reductase [Xylocopilactobacillus apicola]|uniref:Aldehyde oxidoreductase n=1 Tax=Xylocopilactobacillus apicola TaxID=2932184 RepID=A0AAU9DPU2_9LACO|nr:aldo/keto reductase [Xylocopilactobacillus apicola]BDR57844.1 aldehyde oxidoreductase [Xylocopilactobacillus apicola]